MAKSEKKNSSGQSFWRAVFNQSRVNGAAYRGDYLPAHSWIWPRGTFLQRRLRAIREQELDVASGETPGKDELAATMERVERSTSNRLRLVGDPRVEAALGNAGDPPVAAKDTRAEATRLSPTQALLGLEREAWARVKDGAVQPVQIDEKSLQAALHKENMEKFQQTLLQSGQWVRSHTNETPPELTSIDNPEPAAARSAPTPSVRVAGETQGVQGATAITERIETRNKKSEAHDKPNISRDAPRSMPRPQVAVPAASEPAGWDDIDDRLLWLAKPSQ